MDTTATVAAAHGGAHPICEIARLPEDLLLAALALAGPVAACRAAAVCRAFQAAADSDAVWVRFLPRDLPPFADTELISSPPASKKELFMRLSDGPVLLADGLMSMWLHRETGAMCYMLSARKLSIALGDVDETTPANCRWIPVSSSSRFSEAAELRHFRWIEIGGKIDSKMLSQHTTYTVYIVYKLEWYERYGNFFGVPKRLPKKRDDGWMEVEMGEYYNDEGEDGEVSICLKTTPYVKSSLIVLGIDIRPKGLLSMSVAHKCPKIWPTFRAPCNLPSLADGQVCEPLTSMKTMFLRLLDGSILLADGLTVLWIDKETGGICCMLPARKLIIALADNPTYWHWIPINDFRFSEGAELQKAQWLEICGNVDSKILSQHTTYNAYIVYTLAINYYGLHHPAKKTCVSLGGSNKSMRNVCLVDGYRYSERWLVMREYLPEDTHYPRDRDVGWMMEAELGEFHTGDGDDGEVSMSLMDTFGWKCGLVVLGIEIRPKKQGG